MTENDLRKQQVNGFYRDVDLGTPADTESDLERKERELEGITKTKDEDVYNILEFLNSNPDRMAELKNIKTILYINRVLSNHQRMQLQRPLCRCRRSIHIQL